MAADSKNTFRSKSSFLSTVFV